MAVFYTFQCKGLKHVLLSLSILWFWMLSSKFLFSIVNMWVHTHYDCYIFLVNWTRYKMFLFISGNIFFLKSTLFDITITIHLIHTSVFINDTSFHPFPFYLFVSLFLKSISPRQHESCFLIQFDSPCLLECLGH